MRGPYPARPQCLLLLGNFPSDSTDTGLRSWKLLNQIFANPHAIHSANAHATSASHPKATIRLQRTK